VHINPSEIVDENGNAIDLNDTTKLSEWLLKKYQGRMVDVIDDGRSVAFARKGLEASLKRRGDGHRQMYADLESLIVNGIYAGYEPGDSKHENVDRQNIYYAAAEIRGQIYGIRFKIDIFKGYEKEAGKYKDHKIVVLAMEKSLSLNNGNYSVQQNSDLNQPPLLYQDGRCSDVALQNSSGLLIAVPEIRQAFTANIQQNFQNPTL
jgi:hypothetical protein